MVCKRNMSCRMRFRIQKKSEKTAAARCAVSEFLVSTLTFAGGDQKLCMTPNFATDTCYQIPINGGKLADYREVECGASPVENTVIAKTVSRGDGSISCPDDQTKWTFAQPASIGYCLTEDVTAAGAFGG